MPKCKMCEEKYITKKRNKCHIKGFCSYTCYKKTDEFKYKFKKTFIKNRIKDICLKDKSEEEVNDLFHNLKSESVKKSQSKRVKTIRDKGENEFSRMTKLGNRNRKKNFLTDNKIINNNEEISNDEINRLFGLSFNSITNHSKKIKDGLYKKYGEEISKEFKRRYKKAFLNFLNKKNIDISDITVVEYKKELLEFNKKHRYKNVLSWKKTHIINQTGVSIEDANKMPKEEICKRYSQYMCDRMSLVESIHNGYRRTKSGYYVFKSINQKMFYRSSWEETFLKVIDELILMGKIDDIKVPKHIRYVLGGIKRKYYPDFKIIFKDQFRVIEIKPFRKIKEEINQAKFKSAKKELKDNFIVITEQEIFSDLKYEILKIVGE